jgi:hypothetical protein
MEFIGFRSLLIILLTSIFTGMVFALQSGRVFLRFNTETLTGAVATMSIVKELAPVMTALMVTGRAGSAMAAQLGTMRVTEQIDALESMAINPINYLLVPRIIATTVMLPVLTAIFDFVGTAGSYGDAKIFDIIESKTAANIELAFLHNDAYTPLDNVVTTNTTNVKDIVVNSSNYISTNEELAKNFLKFGVGIENMEFFSVLKIAQEFDIPAGGVFCITNYTNDKAHEDFQANHEKAKTLLSAHVQKRIKELTQTPKGL